MRETAHHRSWLALFLLVSLGVHALVLVYGMKHILPASPAQGNSGNSIALVVVPAGEETQEPRQAHEPVPARQSRQQMTTRPAPFAKPASQPDRPPQTAPLSAKRGTNTGPAAENSGHALQLCIQQALQPYFNYPMLARRRGLEGTVVISLRIDANGTISRLQVAGTSRHPLLDRAAIASLEQVKQVPEAVAYLGGRHSDILLPIEYRLTDS